MTDFDYERVVERVLSRNRWGTEGDLAAALGISPNTLTAWKKGRSSFGVHEIPKICDVLGVEAHWLLFGDEPRQEASLLNEVQSIVENVHKMAKVHLSKAGLERTARTYFAALNAEIVSANDTEEVGMRLHLLRKRIEKDLANAAAEPGSGKQSA
ncbi:helix-turn-helix domain-containing protein [Shinella sp. JR1-6]|uniref:helix-turn-helix domain-containing protein n=1 Tax=Shinella sp. JR1-6 TaxID=2527671 RepID=UPI0014055B87|nr:helix-turn-helix transcriptional regulator [Shinella sp. JR1-6]